MLMKKTTTEAIDLVFLFVCFLHDPFLELVILLILPIHHHLYSSAKVSTDPLSESRDIDKIALSLMSPSDKKTQARESRFTCQKQAKTVSAAQKIPPAQHQTIYNARPLKSRTNFTNQASNSKSPFGRESPNRRPLQLP